MSQEQDFLFSKNDLGTILRQIIDGVSYKVESIPEGQFLGSSNDELLEHLYSELETLPLELYEDRMELDDSEAKIDVSGDPLRHVSDRSRPAYVSGLKITVQIPFSGPKGLWFCRPSTYTSSPPFGTVLGPDRNGIGELNFSFENPSDTLDKNNLKSDIDRQLNEIKKYIERVNQDVEKGNQELKESIRQQISQRKGHLNTHASIVESLNIPLKRRPGVPDVQPLPIRRRLVRPLPPPTKASQEYTIADDDYEFILNVIRQEGLTWETSPKTYVKHDEEELRDFILAHLNTHYDGEATGETFRKHGKTDIRIESQNRAAFVGECKVWHGPKKLSETLDQLFGYITWRDCKDAIILFNKDIAGFSQIQDKVPETLMAHPNFITEIKSQQAGEWRFQFKSADDPDRIVTVHVFLFNLFTSDAKE